jgi:type VI secretion system secreted protein VgrG
MANERELTVSGAFEDGTFVVEHLRGNESLGQPFSFDVHLLGQSGEIDISTFVGDTMTVTVDIDEDQSRYFHGHVTRMALVGTSGRHFRYLATLRPWFWLMSARRNSRIFQNKSVPDIAKALFREHGFGNFEDTLSQTYSAREFVVQHQESDFGFVSRLLERAGIYYFFRHEKNKHVLVLADSSAAHQTVLGYEEVPFYPDGTPTPFGGEHLRTWDLARRWGAGAYASDDFNFERPRAELLAARVADGTDKQGQMEVYEYPGGFLSAGEGETYVRGRLEALQSEVELASTSGDVRGIGSADLFTLIDFPTESQNKQYLVVSASYDAANNAHESGHDEIDGYFHASFTTMDSKVPFRPALWTPTPHVQGPQTAIVVGKVGEEIWTDKYGRVKVQFRWDREGQSDENSSCWVRVAQVWAGSGWGGMHIPRIGQEVIVDFLNGDPDRPIITGRVYNGDNMPPYDLPDNQTQSGIKSRSSKGGGPQNFNEIRFEDKKGGEELHVQAERDQTTNVKHDQVLAVGVDRHVTVGGNETNGVGGTRATTVGKKDTQTYQDAREITVAQTDSLVVSGKRTETFKAGRDEIVDQGDSLTVQGSDKTTTVHGQYNITADAQFQVVQGENKLLLKDDIEVSSSKEIHMHNQQCSLDFADGVATVQAASKITFQCGSASISLLSDGTIEIKGANKVTANGGGSGLELAQPGATMSGNNATMSGQVMTEITGAIVKIN